MREGRPSITAEGVTALRAMESMRPPEERICYDPLAKDFVGRKLAFFLKSGLIRKIAFWVVDRIAPGLAGDIIGRVRYIDDRVQSAIREGIEQLVILGAGYDSRPYRLPELNGRIRCFEVDHPATQKVKIERIEKIFGNLPEYVAYVPIDFERDDVGQQLFESGYDRNLRTLYIWEGVTMYLTDEAVDRVLDFVSRNSGEGSSIIFDYVHKSFIDDESCNPDDREYKALERARRAYERIDQPITSEPFTFGIREGAVGEFLSARGFFPITEVTGDFLKGTYFNGPNEKRKVLSICGFVHATVRRQVFR
jgi:methyltransferase (TIGR00027 family)